MISELKRSGLYIASISLATLGLAATVGFDLPAFAQQPVARIVHREPQQMTAGDLRIVLAHRREIMETAEIYGYNLLRGNWRFRQSVCSPMPNTILLHYVEQYGDGTEMLFTALVPRNAGRVRVVPVLYRNVTPFVPAPRNPRNFAIFNRLVPQSVAARALTSSHNWIELSACYAEMTGADIEISKDDGVQAGVVGAPTARIDVAPNLKSWLVTFADRESQGMFRVWSISFNRAGRITAAATEVYPVTPPRELAPRDVPDWKSKQVSPTITAIAPSEQQQPSEGVATSAIDSLPTLPAPVRAHDADVAPPAAAVSQNHAASTTVEVPRSQTALQTQTAEPGWKFVPLGTKPRAKIIPQAPQPTPTIATQPK